LIEALTYRLGDHTTADDAHRYRSDDEVSAHWKEEPVSRLRAYLSRTAGWSKHDEETLVRECAELVDVAAREAISAEKEPVGAIFDFQFAELPFGLRSQRAATLAAEKEAVDG
jgi:pyruvate dehydrogenase E1 component alpha subunit